MANDTVSVLSPEGVALELPVSGPGPRILAYAIDAVFLAILMLGLLVLLALLAPLAELLAPYVEPFVEASEQEALTSAETYTLLLPLLILFMIVSAISELLYFTFFEMATGGRSPGKMILGLRVRGIGGLPIDLRSSLIRNLLRIVDVLPTSYLVGLTSIVLSERRQRLGDHAAGTVVIRTDRTQRASQIVLPATVSPLPLSREQLARLGDAERRLVRATLRRVEGASGERATSLLGQTAAAVRARLELEDAEVGDDLELLQRLLAAAEEQERASLD